MTKRIALCFVVLLCFRGAAIAQAIEALLRHEESILDALDEAVFRAREARAMMEKASLLKAQIEKKRIANEQELSTVKGMFEAVRAKIQMILRLHLLVSHNSQLLVFCTGCEDEIRRERLLKKLVENEAVLLATYQDAIRQMEVQEFEIELQMANSYALESFGREAQKRIEEEERKREAMLKKLEKDREMQMRVAKEMSDAQKELSGKISEMLSKARGPVDFEKMKGRVELPLREAEITVPFGEVVHEQFKTKIPHPGVTLSYRTNQRRNVRAVAFGKVVFVGKVRGWGESVVVDHASGYYTVYAGLVVVQVRGGDFVREGTVIGQVEPEPMSDWVNLYFEIRKDGTPLDPAVYLRTGKDGSR
jgi:murein DD-endopeptidase MepM/ murein hydrolase activator NlpD